ncbi:UDP-N-acetylmuramoyl-tripeptide--D-alanyl-D-alanine ligase [SAR86 cluster bacterium]|nr:UDP-N-acetylmuramoyl-tripeptide--D-alanyl-D-alanine ligase [SAR86 cluster bacterium]
MFKVNSLKKISDYANFLGIDYDGEDFIVEGISFDTRKSKRNQLFIPLKGENFDGNDFLQKAIDLGCVVLTNKKFFKNSLIVEDVYTSLLRLCALQLQKSRVSTIFITGSFGKTTIKDMLKHVLGNKCHASLENQNNEFGVPYTILSLKDEHEDIVIEFGARKSGDFNKFAKFLKCDAFILTGISNSHLETFKSELNTERTKLRLRECLKDSNNFIDGRQIKYQNYKEKNIEIIRKTLKLLDKKRSINFDHFEASAGRGNIIKKYNGEIIDQTYNASPSTVLATLMEFDPKKTTAILGDMAELGDKELEIHINLLRVLKNKSVYVTGNLFKKASDILSLKSITYFKNEYDFPKETLLERLRNNEKVYIKGSRSSRMERYVDILKNG